MFVKYHDDGTIVAMWTVDHGGEAPPASEPSLEEGESLLEIELPPELAATPPLEVMASYRVDPERKTLVHKEEP
jgi:hypothetical protein